MPTPDLATALRGWRARTRPEDSGLPAGSRRRTPGLRREELGALAGLSVDYVTRLEQGRARRPSTQVLGALARALRLDDDERAHLFRLAGAAPPGPDQVPTHLPPSVQRLLDRLVDVPVSVWDAAWELLAWNPLWAGLMGEPSPTPGRQRNLLWNHFTGGTGPLVRSEDDVRAFEEAAVADLRAAAGRYPGDPDLRRLLADLRRTSDRFREVWDAGAVGVHRSDRKTIRHREVGVLTLDCDVLTVQGSDLRIVAYTAPPGSRGADALALLRVMGTTAPVDR